MRETETGVPETRGTKRSSISRLRSGNADLAVAEQTDGFIEGGDSGGPLLYGGQVVAVASTRGGEYSPIDAAWIRETLLSASE